MAKKLIIRREQKQAQYFTEELGDKIGLDMVLIPAGSFWMGTEDEEIERLVKEYNEEWFRAERPQHQVTVPTFFMGRYLITQAQWRVVAGWEQVERGLDPDPSNFKEDYEGIDRWTRPVEQVSLEDAKEFCARLSNRTKRKYRLPTETEWEYACRAGTSTSFHFGETISTELANYNGNYIYGEGIRGESREQTTPVGYFKVANAFGLYDMHGNVFEWCENDLSSYYESAPTDASVWLSGHSTKVIRGGSWSLDPYYCRSTYREDITRSNRGNVIGFRVVCATSVTT